MVIPWLLLRAAGMPDWLDAELLIVFAMAAAGIYTMLSESRAHRREADERIALHARIATVETAIALGAPHTLAERVASLEAQPECSDDLAELRERVTAIETRIDFKPVTHTRRKDGKFAPASDAATCEAPK